MKISIIILLIYFKAAHVFVQSNMFGSWLWNLLGHFEHVLKQNDPLECTQENQCHILFVSVIVISNFIYSYFLKCLPETPLFTMGSSYPPSTHISGSLSHHGLSEPYSRPMTPMDALPLGGSKREPVHVDKELLGKFKTAEIVIKESLCYDMKPTLQVMYQRYTHVNEIYARVLDMVNEWTWPKELGKAPNQTDIVSLFVARTTWHNTYVKILPVVEEYEDMQAWLEENPDCKSDLQIWGVIKSKYTIGDLTEWLQKQKGQKITWSPKKHATKSPSKSESKGKGKEKEIVQKEVETKKKSHKKKKGVAST